MAFKDFIYKYNDKLFGRLQQISVDLCFSHTTVLP